MLFHFQAVDNGGKHHSYTYKAKDKQEAIDKGFKRARKNAKGDIGVHWEVKILSYC